MPYIIALNAPSRAFAELAAHNGNPDGLNFLKTETHPPFCENFHTSRLNTHLSTTDVEQATGFTIFEQRFAQLTAHRLQQAGHRATVIYRQPKPIRALAKWVGIKLA